MAAIVAPGIESPSAKLIAPSWSHCAACSIASGISAEWSGFSALIWVEAGEVAAAPARRAIRASFGPRAAISKSHAKASRITAVAVRLRDILHCPLALQRILVCGWASEGIPFSAARLSH